MISSSKGKGRPPVDHGEKEERDHGEEQGEGRTTLGVKCIAYCVPRTKSLPEKESPGILFEGGQPAKGRSIDRVVTKSDCRGEKKKKIRVRCD